MNKYLLLTGLLFFFSQALSAQWSFGLKAGLNRTNVEEIWSASDLPFEVEAYTNDTKIGFHVGLLAAYAFSDKVALRGELLYSTKGFQSAADSSTTDGFKLNMNYLSLPILIDYQPLPKLHLVAGPSFSYRVLLDSDPNTDNPFFSLEDIWNNSFDFSLATGLEYGIGEHLRLGVRYLYALTAAGKVSLVDENATPIEEGIQWKNRTLQISAMFWL